MAPTSAHCCRIAVWEEKQLKVKKKRHKGLGRLGCAMPALPATGEAIALPATQKTAGRLVIYPAQAIE
jgi:hypothetical protein